MSSKITVLPEIISSLSYLIKDQSLDSTLSVVCLYLLYLLCLSLQSDYFGGKVEGSGIFSEKFER
jgi:hypothetical protein